MLCYTNRLQKRVAAALCGWLHPSELIHSQHKAFSNKLCRTVCYACRWTRILFRSVSFFSGYIIFTAAFIFWIIRILLYTIFQRHFPISTFPSRAEIFHLSCRGSCNSNRPRRDRLNRVVFQSTIPNPSTRNKYPNHQHAKVSGERSCVLTAQLDISCRREVWLSGRHTCDATHPMLPNTCWVLFCPVIRAFARNEHAQPEFALSHKTLCRSRTIKVNIGLSHKDGKHKHGAHSHMTRHRPHKWQTHTHTHTNTQTQTPTRIPGLSRI